MMEHVDNVNVYLIITVLLTVLNLFAYLAMGLFVWIAKNAMRDLRDLEKAHTALVTSLPREYVLDARYRSDQDKLAAILDKISNHLNEKADRRDVGFQRS